MVNLGCIAVLGLAGFFCILLIFETYSPTALLRQNSR